MHQTLVQVGVGKLKENSHMLRCFSMANTDDRNFEVINLGFVDLVPISAEIVVLPGATPKLNATRVTMG